MISNQNSNDTSEALVNRNQKLISIEKDHYFNPIACELRWFKGSRDRGMRSNMA